MGLCLYGVMAQLRARYLRVGVLRDPEEFIQIGGRMMTIHLTIYPAGHPYRAMFFSKLGFNLFELSVRTGPNISHRREY